MLTSLEICAGAGGQAIGLHAAGFRHRALLEIDADACRTLRANIEADPTWQGCEVIEGDVKETDVAAVIADIPRGELDLLAGGVPCPPFSIASKQLGEDDERDLFPRMVELADELRPRAIMIENVKGILAEKFAPYRRRLLAGFAAHGYRACGWRLLNAADYGVPQLRPRAILVLMREDVYTGFAWPEPDAERVTVAQALGVTMAQRLGADSAEYATWREAASQDVAPTLVGGSKKHGGPDLGPTRARAAWAKLGVDGRGVATEGDPKPERELYGEYGPKINVEQAAIIQGFPPEWQLVGGKTARYRQVGNAFPPPVAEAVGRSIAAALRGEAKGLHPEGPLDGQLELQDDVGQAA